MEDAAPASAIPSWPKFWMKLTIVVVTTNFDNLVADAMAIHASRSH